MTDDDHEEIDGISIEQFPDTREGQIAFLAKAIELLRQEIDCMAEHVEHEEWPGLVAHLASDVDGMKTMIAAVLELMDKTEAAYTMAMLARDKAQAITGMPHEVVEVKEGVYAVIAQEVEVPNDISGLMNE